MTSQFSNAENTINCFVEGQAAKFGFSQLGIRIDFLQAKKLYGYFFKWFHVIGAQIADSNGEDAQVKLFYSRRHVLESNDFVDTDPTPDDTQDPSHFTIIKYPKLSLESLIITFSDAKTATKIQNGIRRRLKKLGQVPGKRWRVFLNPYSGTKKGRKIWASLQPILDIAGVIVELIETQRARHAYDLVFSMDLDTDMIVSVSGDGMMHEIVNGLMHRPDWHKASQIPIGVIPTGTGNALASSLMHPTPISSVLSMLKSTWRPLDLMAIYQYTPALNAPVNQPSTSQISPTSSPPSSIKSLNSDSSPTTNSSSAASTSNPPGGGREEGTSSKKRKRSKSSLSSSSSSSNQVKSDHENTSPPSSGKFSGRSVSTTSPNKLRTQAGKDLASHQVAHEAGTWNLVCYSFQALMWGFVSDVDFETEPLRWMGDFRFTLGSIRRILSLRHYPARLLMLDAEGDGKNGSKSEIGQVRSTCTHVTCETCQFGHHAHKSRIDRIDANEPTSSRSTNALETITSNASSRSSPPPTSSEQSVNEKATSSESVDIEKNGSVSSENAPQSSRKSKKKMSSKEDLPAEIKLSTETEAKPNDDLQEEKALSSSPSTAASKHKQKRSRDTTKFSSNINDCSNIHASYNNDNENSIAIDSITIDSNDSPKQLQSKSEVQVEKTENSSSPPAASSSPVVSKSRSASKPHKRKKEEVGVEDAEAGVDAEHDHKPKGRSKSIQDSKPPLASPIMRGGAPGLSPIIEFDPMTQTDAPTGWIDIDDKFIFFVASNITHLSSDLKVAPFAHASSGAADVVYCTALPKTTLLELLSGEMENGKFVARDGVHYTKARALILIPTGKPGVMDLDGEEYLSAPTAVEIHPGVLRVCAAIWNLSLNEDDV